MNKVSKAQNLYIVIISIAVLFALPGCRISDDLERLYVRAKIADSGQGARTKSEINTFSNSTIGVFVDDEDGYYSPVTNSIAVVTSGSVTAAPSPDIFINAPAKVYAYYPASSNELVNPTSASTIDVHIEPGMPLEYQTDYLWADPVDVSRTNRTNVPLTFHHALAKVIFTVILTDSYDGSTILNFISLSCPSDPTHLFKSGYGKMSIADGTISNLENEDIFLTFDGRSQTLSKTTEIEIISLVAPTRLADSTSDESPIELFLRTGDNNYVARLPVNHIAEWVGGTTYKYNITLGSEEMTIDGVTATPWIDETDIDIDVSTTTATANCYIIAPDDTLTIPVDIKGNGGNVAGTNIPVTHRAASVGILWQTKLLYQDIDLISLGNFDEGLQTVDIISESGNYYPYGDAISISGNAVIAAYSGPARTGEILWSWHIWVTDYNPNVPSNGTTYGYTNSIGVSYEFMDRNLGATSVEPQNSNTYGLLYQWGRKDPFVNSRYYNAGQDLPVSGAAISKITISPPIDTTIAHPTFFYCPGNGLPYNNNGGLWGGYPDGVKKTIFDPCPAGWRVPSFMKSNTHESPWSGIDAFARSWNYNGYAFSGFGFWPASGARLYSSGNLSDVGSKGEYWSASRYGDGASTFTFNSSSVYLDRNYYRTSGYAVRCVRE